VNRAARGAKVEALKKVFSEYPNFEVVEIADITSGDFSDAFTCN
jgi:hypothetical protein